ncbi:MAG TPA: hypothetical protein VFO38_06005 [Candidatus Saccharimonadales bacterium]|nr:hypothetical protein [Candidatus Saccharimonadales bacterium]
MTATLEGRPDGVQPESLPHGTPVGTYFAHALVHGVGREALLRIARNYLDFDGQGDPVGLPYVGVLIRAGWSAADIGSFLEALCFGYDTSHLHRRAFWLDETAQCFVGTYSGLFEFVKRMATDDPSAVLSANAHNSMQRRFVALSGGDESAALSSITELQMLALRYLRTIESPYQLNVALFHVKKLGPFDGIKLAARMALNSLGLRLYGAILATRSQNVDELLEPIDKLLDLRPDLAVQVYRLLTEGAVQSNRDYAHVLIKESPVHELFTRRGWHFARVEQREDGVQQVVVWRPNAETIVLRHSGEPLSANMEVMVHEAQLKGLPSTMVPGMKIYNVPLSPTTSPVEPASCELLSHQKSV